jgi:hypothetical protein
MDIRNAEQQIDQIIARVRRAGIQIESDAYPNVSPSYLLHSCLKRAAIDQAASDPATPSRFGIWANDLRGYTVEAARLLRAGNIERAIALLTQTANALEAFCEIQGVLHNELPDDDDDRQL